MSKQQVIIIGSGLGGLSCGVILAKNGYQVTVLEQAHQVGGCLQCFTRRGAHFETGMHFIGSASEGQTLDRMLQYLEVKKDILLSPLDSTGYEVVSFGGKTYRYASGREAFIEQLAKDFPHQRNNLVRYYQLIEQIANASSIHSLKYAESDTALNTEYQLRSVNDVLDEIITDPLLAKVLVGNLPLYAAERNKTPFATHAFIMDFYNQSAYRIVGGSEQLAKSLVKTICHYGGQVLTGQRVKRIVCDETHATGVETSKEVFFPADYIISDAHPIRTLELVDSKLIRPAFRQRINAIPQTVGCFSVYLDFKKDTLPYMNYNYYGYMGDTPWDCEHYDESQWPKGYLYMHFCEQPNQHYATSGVIISYMQMSDVAQWADTRVGRRGTDYEAFKERKARLLLHSLEQSFPGITDNIAQYYTSTPLTYRDYTGTEGGGMYGVAKDINSSIACRVPHKTKIPNLLQTGQNINSHGMLGVLVGTVVTCSELLTAKTIYQQIVEEGGGV